MEPGSCTVAPVQEQHADQHPACQAAAHWHVCCTHCPATAATALALPPMPLPASPPQLTPTLPGQPVGRPLPLHLPITL